MESFLYLCVTVKYIMNRRVYYLIILLVGLLSCSSLCGQENYFFKQISVRDGLTQSTVRTTFYDSKGFLWIGTGSGINRFDTHDLKCYQNSATQPNVLPSNLIQFIIEDNENNLWVGTDAGLAQYNYTDDRFEQIELVKGEAIHFRSAYSTPTGVFFGGIGELYYYSYEQAEIVRLSLNFNSDEPFKDIVLFIAPRDDRSFYIGTRRDGLWLYYPSTHKMSKARFCVEKEIVAYHVDLLGQLWLSPYGEGVQVYSATGELIQNYTTENSELSSNIVLDIEDRANEVWLATDGAGISIVNQVTDSISIINHIPGDVNSFPVSSILSLYKDSKDNMWAGSVRGGLIGVRKVFMKSYADVVPHNTQGLTEKTVLSLYEDNDGILWIGTDGGGVNSFNPSSGKFTHYDSTIPDKVASITHYDSRHLLLSMFGKGLYLFNKQTGVKKPLPIIDKPLSERFLYSGVAVNGASVSTDSIYLFADQVYLFKPSLINSDKPLEPQFPSRKVSSFQQIKSSFSSVFYLSNIKTVFEFNYREKSLIAVFSAVGNEKIQAIAEGEENELWIGTNEGLYHLNLKEDKTTRIDTRLFHEITSLLYHSTTGLWIGAQASLLNYQPQTGAFNLVGESNGAMYNEYLAKPTLVSSANRVYLGGVLGLLEIDDDIDLQNKELPRLSLSALTVNGVSSLDKIEEGKIKIPSSYSSLALRVLSKEEDIFRERAYRYYINGLERDLIESKDNSLLLYALPIGKYDISVSCTTKDGSWLAPVKLLHIVVTPPWWRSSFAIVVWALVVVGLWIGVYFLNKRRREQKLLEYKQQEIQQRNEERIRFLINISHELRTPLTLIYAPLKRILQELNKDSSHYQELFSVFRQTKEMRDLINMILDMRRLEMRDHSLVKDKVYLPHFIAQFLLAFKSESEAKEIDIIEEIACNSVVELDKAKCEIILSNLVMNALKFTPSDSTLVLRIYSRDSFLRFEVIDEGIGLSEEDLKSVFTRFYQGEHTIKGSGIGLSYAKELVEVQGGEIGAFNNETNGATFWFEVPLVESDEEVEAWLLTNVVKLSQDNQLEANLSIELSLDLALYSLAIVEDDDDMRQFLHNLFVDRFKSVTVYSNGKEALEGISKSPVELVLSDVMMPYMDGYELCKRIKESLAISHIPVILLTARADTQSEHIGYKVGADAYLAKPFDPDLLLSLMRNLLFTREQIRKQSLNSDQVLDSVEATFSPSDEQFIDELNSIINENIGDPDLDVAFITQEIGMSRASLYNKLKAIGGVGVNDYIISCRIHKASTLLVSTDSTIGEISDLLGFSNQRYFSTVFKQVKGVSPTQFRKQFK